MAKREGLTKKEKAFCEYYALENESATRAYLKAYEGCCYSTAQARAYKVLRKPLVKEYIEALQKQAFETACISAEKVALKLSEIAFSSKDDKEYNATAQLKALDLLQKQMSLQNQNINANVETTIKLVIEE